MEVGSWLVDYGIAGAVLVMAWLAFAYIKHRDTRDAAESKRRSEAVQKMADSCHDSHAQNTASLVDVTNQTTKVLQQVAERLGENTTALQENAGALRDVREELKSRRA